MDRHDKASTAVPALFDAYRLAGNMSPVQRRGVLLSAGLIRKRDIKCCVGMAFAIYQYNAKACELSISDSIEYGDGLVAETPGPQLMFSWQQHITIPEESC